MSFLIQGASPVPVESAQSLLSLREGEALGAALAAMEVEEVTGAVSRAATLEERGRLLWALAPERRRDVLDELHPGIIGALIQNREEENRRLLADLSREQFSRLLRFCSPEQAYYWLSLATSFKDARANMLPLLVPVEELAGALLSTREFARHCQEVGDYSVEELTLDVDEFADIASATVTVSDEQGVQEEFPILEGTPVRDPRLRHLLHTLEHHPDRYSATVTIISVDGAMEELPVHDSRLRRLLHKILDWDLQQYTALLNLFGPEGVLREFPVRNRRLRRLLQTILEMDPSYYVALVQAALRLLDDRAAQTEETRLMREEPILLDRLMTVEEERARAGLASSPPAEREKGGEAIPGEAAMPECPVPAQQADSPHVAGREGLRHDADCVHTPANADPLGEEPSAAEERPPNPAPNEIATDEGGNMVFPTHGAALSPDDPVHALLALEENEALKAALAGIEPEAVALAVGRVPGLEERGRVLWALTPERRRDVLDLLHPGFIGALIQNQPAENQRLLGDISREQFTRLLRYCSPERAYYWLTLATSFEDARANLLPQLVPIRELAGALLTQPEFETHCERIGDYSIEGLGLDLAQQFADVLEGFRDLAYAIITVFGPDGMLREFPIKDPRLRRLLRTILDHSPEHYAQLIHTALQISKYGQDHVDEPEMLQEEPILLEDLLSLEEERARAGLSTPPGTAGRPKAADIRSVPSLPVRRSAELMRVAASQLPAERQGELSQELQLLYMQEAAYAGGSFAQVDLERAAGRVQSYVQLGLAGLAEGDAGQAAQLLSEQRLRTLMESGARQVERLRQVALRLQPWGEVLDARQVTLLGSLEHPDMGVEEETGRPVLRVPAVKRGEAPRALDLEQVRVELEAVSAWVTLVRAVGKGRIVRRVPGSSPAALTRCLVVAAVLYRHWDPALVDAKDLARFRQTYLDPATGRFNETAFRALAEAVRTLAAERHLTADAVQEIARLLARSMDELTAAPTADETRGHGDTEKGTKDL